MKKFNSVMVKISVIAGIICVMCVMALGALFVMSRNETKVGAYGTYCNKKECGIAIHDGLPTEDNEIVMYYLIDKDQISMTYDFNEYFYLVDNTKEELEKLGYDVSEESNEKSIYESTGRYAMGYYNYIDFYD